MESMKIIKRVISTEIKGLQKNLDMIDNSIEEVVSLIINRKGKVIFSGVGKSGHIGKKLAATFSSLGIPSFFVHSSESLHGDLGMIEKEDIVFLLSNSGSTKEVLSMLATLKKIGCKTIAFTSKKNSPLALQTDYQLIYYYEGEADHLGVAPTSSAIAMLSLGDAIPIAISEMNHFSHEDFHMFHPGGALGELLSADEYKEGRK